VTDPLETESLAISQYLLAVRPGRDLVQRYRDANAELCPEQPAWQDRAMLDFVRRHPRSLPLFDAASGVLRPHSLLRRKILVMMAILETTPQFAAHFDTENAGRLQVLAKLGAYGLRSVVTTVAGLLMYAIVIGTRHRVLRE
jgi:hypothetical protein